MSSIANLALQNGTGVATVGTAIVPSAGDSVWAQWRIENALPPFARTILGMLSRFNNRRTARHMDVKITMPYTATDANTGQQILVSTALFTGTLIVPTNIPSSNTNDFVAYIRTFFADPGIEASLEAGYAPT